MLKSVFAVVFPAIVLLWCAPNIQCSSGAANAADSVAAAGSDELQLAIAAAEALSARGDFLAALTSFEHCLSKLSSGGDDGQSQEAGSTAAQQLLQHQHEQLARIHLGMAQALVQADRFAPALVLFERVLHMEMSGNESVENAVKGSALGGYAVALTKAGRYKQAARVAEQAASVAEQLYGPHHENTLTSRFNLGAVYEASGTRACSCSCACSCACACVGLGVGVGVGVGVEWLCVLVFGARRVLFAVATRSWPGQLLN
jgi:tetratricopeptide (TPR) repeat protein